MKNKLNLKDVEWKEINFLKLFKEIFIAPATDSNKLSNGNTVFVGRSSSNNGYQGEVSITSDKIIFSNCITVSMVGEPKAFYQPYDFTCSQNILILRNDTYINKFNAQFLCQIINAYLKTKGFGYGYPVGLNRIIRNSLLLPVSNNKPNWQFMEDYIKQEQKEITEKVVNYYQNKLDEILENTTRDALQPIKYKNVNWKVFEFNDIFREIKRGKRLTKANQIDGKMPYISSSAMNNGVDNFISNDEKVRKFDNCLSVANSGSVGACFYHKYEYVASDHITSLKLDNENADEYIYLFMASIISRLEEKYSFNREINDIRIQREKLILPADENGNPNYKYMKNFVINIQKDNIEKTLEYIYIYIYNFNDCSEL